MNIFKKRKSLDKMPDNHQNILDANTIEKLLDEEISKPNPDFKYIDELSEALIKAYGGAVPEIDVDEAYEKFKVASKQRKIVRSMPKWAYGAVACAVMLFCGNIYTVSAHDMNIFSFAVEYMEGGVKIDFNQKPEIVLPTSEDDPYGIIAVLAENGIENVETPHYIPEGFILTYIETDDIPDYSTYVSFTYENGKQLISLTYDKYVNEEDAYNICIPSDEHNISEININGHPAVMSREDDQMIVVVQYYNIIFNIATRNVDYSECDSILASYV